MLIVWFRLYLQQSLIQNTMQTTKREARRNSVNIMDNKHGVGDIICHAHIFLPKCDTSYLGHDETSSGHDVSHMHLTQIASLRTLTEPFRFSRFNIITKSYLCRFGFGFVRLITLSSVFGVRRAFRGRGLSEPSVALFGRSITLSSVFRVRTKEGVSGAGL